MKTTMNNNNIERYINADGICNRIPKRGDIFYADLRSLEHSQGSEQTGRRPVMIIQNNVGNQYSPTTIVAILTSKKKRNLPTHVEIGNVAGLSKPSTACLEQIKTIDKSRLERYCGHIGNEMMQKVEKAMLISLGAYDNSHYDRAM